jgi:hypothetical protein
MASRSHRGGHCLAPCMRGAKSNDPATWPLAYSGPVAELHRQLSRLSRSRLFPREPAVLGWWPALLPLGVAISLAQMAASRSGRFISRISSASGRRPTPPSPAG